MKKLTVMAACAALLLGGGVFMKVNMMNNGLIDSNVEALSWEEQVYVVYEGGSGMVEDHDANQWANSYSSWDGGADAAASNGGVSANVSFSRGCMCIVDQQWCNIYHKGHSCPRSCEHFIVIVFG